MDDMKATNPYALGHAQPELERLIAQGRFIGDLTEQVLRLAGLEAGMRVLDIGCGAGDVSFLAAKLVGPSGNVIGVDKSPEAVGVAQKRAQSAGITNVQFMAADVNDLTLDAPVDALIGRLVLMYFPNPGQVLNGLRRHLKPGGIVAFQEMDAESAVSMPQCEVFWAAGQRLNQTFARVGADVRAGLKLPAIFTEAGLPAPQLIQLGRVEYGPESLAYGWMEQLTRTLLPVIVKTGVATAEEVGVDTLAARIRDEVVAKNAVLVLPPFIGAWAKKPE